MTISARSAMSFAMAITIGVVVGQKAANFLCDTASEFYKKLINKK